MKVFLRMTAHVFGALVIAIVIGAPSARTAAQTQAGPGA